MHIKQVMSPSVRIRPVCLCELRSRCVILADETLSLWYFEPAWFYSYPEVFLEDHGQGIHRETGISRDIRMSKNNVINGRVSRYLARVLTGNSQVTLARDQITGKPYAVEDDSFRFNISHSDNCSVFGAMRGAEVGVDIEELCDAPDAVSSIPCFLADAESAVLRKDSSGYERSVLRLWTLKEAFSKVSGRGIYEDFPTLDFSCMVPEGINSGNFGGVTLYTPEINDNVVVSVAVAACYKSVEVCLLRPESCCLGIKRY